MFGKVKKWLGIEGVKVELLLPEEVRTADGVVNGKLRFFSMNPQTVNSIHIKMIERYARGRNDDRLVDEYQLGAISLKRTIDIPANQPVELSFSLPFNIQTSRMDDLASDNLLLNPLVKLSKWWSKVSSEYRLEVEANAVGVALNPFDKKNIRLK